MSGITLKPQLLTADRFKPFGNVIEAAPTAHAAMNELRFERFDDLVDVDVDTSPEGRVAVSIARCRTPTKLPYRVEMVERHPLGSQAFIPLQRFVFIVVVGRAGEDIEAADLQAFITNGRQGINYHKGVWHMPLIALEAGHDFLVIDRVGEGANCDQVFLSDTVTLTQ
ncbi:MAG: ureidoglycolate lyase [Gammaproteobacteria bacterium]|nr:ureidoglycolate lyase [Gammaproteobacteria bacterium]MDH5213534.1 ureidoglycolate lyase [Gammaproteobacteria bacterium]MDH5501769.1 ureidoglycolate lyase [Gammaproteobacteria bacterium]